MSSKLEVKSGLKIRPDCQGCNKKESALMVVRGLFLCGDCIIKIQNSQQEQMLKIIKENGTDS